MEATKENKLLNFNDYRNKLDNISLICLGSLSHTSPIYSQLFSQILDHMASLFYSS